MGSDEVVGSVPIEVEVPLELSGSLQAAAPMTARASPALPMSLSRTLRVIIVNCVMAEG